VDGTITVKPSPVKLGEIIAERTFCLFRTDGSKVQITVKLGKPSVEETLGHYRCPLQVRGVGNERLYAPWGEDPFVALQYAIDLAGQLLDAAIEREGLLLPADRENLGEKRWVWRYPPDDQCQTNED
jgi:hypothetical protein